MKTFLFALFSLFVLASSAQTNVYHNFPDTNFIWVETSNGIPQGNCCCGGTCISNYSYQNFFDGDTTFNSQRYSKIYQTGSVNSFIVGQPTCPPWCNNATSTYEYFTHQYTDAIRTDSVAKTVYHYTNGQDELLYDFSLQVGDSARGMVGAPYRNYVSAIDSVLVGSNYHKRFWLTEWNGHQLGYDSAYANIIEGIGGSQGLLYPIEPVFERIGNIVCAYDNMIPVYPANQAGCAIPDGIHAGSSRPFYFNLSPNPGNGSFTVYSNMTDATLSIFDMRGSQIYHAAFAGQSQDVRIPGHASGIYQVRLRNSSGQEQVKVYVAQ